MKYFVKIVICIVSLMLVTQAHALIVPKKPAPGVFIADTVNIISKNDETKIREIAQKLHRDRGVPIVVVTIDSLLSYTDDEYLGIERYSKELFKHWGIGSKAHNYGILLLVSRDDKTARIQYGSGWGYLYDDQAQNIMDKTMIPFFEKRKYSKGIKKGVVQLSALARTELKFLVNKRDIAAASLIFFAMCGFCMHLLLEKPADERKKFRFIYTICVGLSFYVLFVCIERGAVNYIESVTIMAIWLVMTLASLIWHFFALRKNHDFDQSLKETLILAAMIVVAFFVIIWMTLNNRNDPDATDEYGDGDADFGGGATGSWD